ARQFPEVLSQRREPERDAGALDAELPLQGEESAEVLHDPLERRHAAHSEIGLPRRGVQGGSILVKAGIDKELLAAGCQEDDVGIEQDVDAAFLEVTDHLRQVRVQQRLAEAVEHGALQAGRRVHHPPEVVEREVMGTAVPKERERAGPAQGVAIVAHLEIERLWRLLGDERGERRHGAVLGAPRAGLATAASPTRHPDSLREHSGPQSARVRGSSCSWPASQWRSAVSPARSSTSNVRWSNAVESPRRRASARVSSSTVGVLIVMPLKMSREARMPTR